MAGLERLDTVDWHALHHAHGPADDVPDLLRALVDPAGAPTSIKQEAAAGNKSIQDHVKWTLWRNVLHEGRVWQASAAVVPFLGEILRHGSADARLRWFLVDCLHALACEIPPENVFPIRMDIELIEELERLTAGQYDPGGEPNLEHEGLKTIWHRDCYQAVEREMPTIHGLVDDADSDVALTAMACSASFPRVAAGAIRVLTPVAGTGGVRAGHAVLTLAVLDAEAGVPHAMRLAESEDPVVALMGACALVLAGVEHVTTEVATLLSVSLYKFGDVWCAHTGTLDELVDRCQAELRERWLGPTVESLACAHESERDHAMLSLTPPMLRLAFRGRSPPIDAAKLTDIQRLVVTAIRDYGPFEIGGTQFENYAQVVEACGLPADAKSIHAWLRGRRLREPRAPVASGRAGTPVDDPSLVPTLLRMTAPTPDALLTKALTTGLIGSALILTKLLSSGHRAAAGWVGVGMLAVGAVVIYLLRRMNDRRAREEATRLERIERTRKRREARAAKAQLEE